MMLFTKTTREKLIENGQSQDAVRGTDQEIDHTPVVRLFTPDADCTWLLTELDSSDPDIAFGLCDLGMGCAELGSVRVSELESVRGKLGLPVERDLHWSPKGTLGDYCRVSWPAGRIIEP